MVRVDKYQEELKAKWDEFLRKSKNGTLLHYREFMEYHSDRFEDHSLMFYKDGQLVGLLPANVSNDTLYSHQGLTYGGVILAFSTKLHLVVDIFNSLYEYLKSIDVYKFIYKPIPGFYHREPSHEDDYCIFLRNGQLIRRDTGFVVNLKEDIQLQGRRKRAIKKAKKEGVIIEKSSFSDFWDHILIPNLKSRFGVTPVHSLDEINHLASQFPEAIIQYNAIKDSKIVAGTTLFLSGDVIHAQYISGDDYGRSIGAIDYLFYFLMTEVFNEKKYFSFGIANENQGRTLNDGLVDWKEGFGSNVWIHNFYQLIIE